MERLLFIQMIFCAPGRSRGNTGFEFLSVQTCTPRSPVSILHCVKNQFSVFTFL